MNGRWLPLLAGAWCMAGCVIETPGPPQHDFRTIDLDKSELVRVHLKMGAGNLRVDSATDKLAAADFTYNVPDWKPEVLYRNSDGRGDLTIRQPETHHPRFGKTDYEWDLRLNRQVPMEFMLEFGAGEAHLDLGGMALRDVEIQMGVGKLDLDLHGRPQQSYDVRISGGVGEATVHLPAGVKVDANVEGGIGSVQASGLRHNGHRYYTDSDTDSKATIHMDIQGGVGSIRLLSD